MNWWFYIILLPLLVLGWVWCIYWMRRAKGKTGNFWKVTIIGVIQLCILGAIAYSAIEMGKQAKLTRVSVEQQKNLIRPWLYVDVNKIDIEIDGSIFKFSYFIDHTGQTPAVNIRSVGMISNKESYPKDRIRKLYSDVIPAFIFPNQEKSPQKSIEFDMVTFKKELKTEEYIVKYLMNNNLFFHSYIEYFDMSNNKYCLGFTYAFRVGRITSEGVFPQFIFIDQFHTPIEN